MANYLIGIKTENGFLFGELITAEGETVQMGHGLTVRQRQEAFSAVNFLEAEHIAVQVDCAQVRVTRA